MLKKCSYNVFGFPCGGFLCTDGFERKAGDCSMMGSDEVLVSHDDSAAEHAKEQSSLVVPLKSPEV